MTGYLKLYRQFLAWEWYSDLPVRVLFLHCLLKANYNPAKWKGKTIKTGQFVTSLAHLAQETGLTLQQTRTALSKLKSTCELTQHSTSQYSIITVNNWGKWQCEQHAEQQASNKRATTIKERKKNKNSNTSYIKVSLSIEEREILKNYLLETSKRKIDDIDAYIRRLIDNGDYVSKLEKAKRRLKRQEEKKKQTEAEEIPVITPEEDKKIREIQKKFKEKMRDDRRKKRFNQ